MASRRGPPRDRNLSRGAGRVAVDSGSVVVGRAYHSRICRRRVCDDRSIARDRHSRNSRRVRGRGRRPVRISACVGQKWIGPMSTLRVYILVMRRMRPYAGRLALAITKVLLIAALEILKPWPLKIVIDNVLRGQPMRMAWASAMAPGQLLIAACAGLVGLYLAGAVLQVSNCYLTISIGQRMVNDLRARLFDHLQSLSLSFHRRREIGDLMVRITYDTYSIQTIAMNGFFPVLSASILLAGMFIVMIHMDVTLTMVALAIIPMMIILIVSISGRI